MKCGKILTSTNKTLRQKHDVNYYDIKCDIGLERMITASQNKKSNLSLEIKKEIERVGKDKCLKNM